MRICVGGVMHPIPTTAGVPRVFDRPAAPDGDNLVQALALQRVMADLAPAHARTVRLGRYRIDNVIGAGGFGRVFRGRDEALGRDVAIKLLRLSDSTEVLHRKREAQLLARTSHPNVVQVFDVFTEEVQGETQLAIVMELLDGETLTKWSLRSERTRDEILDAYIDLSRATEALHHNGIVHRDIKPNNVMRTSDGRVVLLDLGIAVSDRTLGTFRELGWVDTQAPVIGTPRYMPPENLQGARPGEAVDVYALCASAFESLTARPPFAGSPDLMLRQKLEGISLRPDETSDEVLAILVRGLDPDPEARWQTCRALRRALQRARKRWTLAPTLGGLGLACGLSLALLSGDAAPRVEPCHALELPGDVRSAPLGADLEDYADRRARVAESCGGLEEPTRALSSACLSRLDERMLRRVATQTSDEALPRPEACLGPHVASLDPLPSDPAQRARILELQILLDGWRSHPATVYASRDALLREAGEIDYGPLLAQTYLTLGRAIASHEVQFEDPAELFESAYIAALGSGDDRTAMEAAMASTGYAQWLGEAEHWAENAFAIARRGSASGNEPADVLSMVLVNLVHHARMVGDVHLASEHANRAVDLAERCPTAFCLVKALTARGSLEIQTESLEDAMADLAWAVELGETVLERGVVGAEATNAARRELARVYRELGRGHDAEEVLVAIVASPQTSPMERRTSWAELCRTIGVSHPHRVFEGIDCFDRWERRLALDNELVVGDRARVGVHRGLLLESAGLEAAALVAYRGAATQAEVDDLGPDHQVTRAALENLRRLEAARNPSGRRL